MLPYLDAVFRCRSAMVATHDTTPAASKPTFQQQIHVLSPPPSSGASFRLSAFLPCHGTEDLTSRCGLGRELAPSLLCMHVWGSVGYPFFHSVLPPIYISFISGLRLLVAIRRNPTTHMQMVRQARASVFGAASTGGCASAESPPSSTPLLPPPSLASALLAARDGCIPPLVVMTVDVLAVPCDATNRTPVTSKDDPVICIASDIRLYGTKLDLPRPSSADAGRQLARLGEDGGSEVEACGRRAPALPHRVVFLLTGMRPVAGSMSNLSERYLLYFR